MYEVRICIRIHIVYLFARIGIRTHIHIHLKTRYTLLTVYISVYWIYMLLHILFDICYWTRVVGDLRQDDCFIVPRRLNFSHHVGPRSFGKNQIRSGSGSEFCNTQVLNLKSSIHFTNESIIISWFLRIIPFIFYIIFLSITYIFS